MYLLLFKSQRQLLRYIGVFLCHIKCYRNFFFKAKAKNLLTFSPFQPYKTKALCAFMYLCSLDVYSLLPFWFLDAYPLNSISILLFLAIFLCRSRLVTLTFDLWASEGHRRIVLFERHLIILC